MSEEGLWYLVYCCNSCGKRFTQYPAVEWDYCECFVKSLQDGRGFTGNGGNIWIKDPITHLCSETEKGIARLVGFSRVSSSVINDGASCRDSLRP